MSNQQTPDDDFDKFLSQNDKISQLYQQSKTSGPDETTDSYILAEAKKPLQHSHTTSRWLLPLGLAASLGILAIIFILLVQPTSDSPIIAKDEQSDRHYEGNIKPNPAQSLEHIVSLIRQGQIEQARRQFEAFNLLYKDYHIDMEKYPELKQLDTDNP